MVNTVYICILRFFRKDKIAIASHIRCNGKWYSGVSKGVNTSCDLYSALYTVYTGLFSSIMTAHLISAASYLQ